MRCAPLLIRHRGPFIDCQGGFPQRSQSPLYPEPQKTSLLPSKESAGARPVWQGPPIVLRPESRCIDCPGGIGPAATFFLGGDRGARAHPHRPFIGVPFPHRAGGHRSCSYIFSRWRSRCLSSPPIVLSSESRSSRALAGSSLP